MKQRDPEADGRPADPSSTTPGSSSFRIGSLLFPIYVPSFLVGLGFGMVVPVIPLYITDFGAGLALTGLIVALRRVGNLLFDLPGGALASRSSKKSLMLLATLLICSLALLIGLSRSLPIFAVLSFALGGAQTLWMVSRLSYLKLVVPAENRGRVLSLIGGVMRIANFLAPIMGGFLGKLLGLRAVFLVQAGTSALGFLVILTQMQADQSRGSEGDGLGALRRFTKTVSEHKQSFLTSGVAVVALSLLRSGRMILIPLWGKAMGLDVAQIGLVLGASSALGMTMFYPAGIIMDRFGRKWAAVPCFILLSLSLGLLPLAQGFGSLLLLGMLMGFGNGFGSGIVMTLGSDLAPVESTGEFLGIWLLISHTGAAMGPLLIGAIAQALTLGLASLVTAGIGLGGAGVMIFLVAETLQHGKQN